jgi:hypothetical protein
MEVYGIFGFILGIVAFMMSGFAVAETSQLRKEIQKLRERLAE